MNPVTAQARRSRHRPRTGGLALGATGARRRKAGPHTTRATATGTTHSPRAGAQPTPAARSAGTVTPAARAAPADRHRAYRPVISATLVGWSRLTRAGRATLVTPIEAPISVVPAKRVAGPGARRTSMPARSPTRVSARRRSRPA